MAGPWFADTRRSVYERWSVIAYRAWISTLGLLAIAVLLTTEDQTRDILWSINETMQLATRGLMSEGFRWAGVKSYAVFWCASFLLAAILALIARVTGSLDFAKGETASPQRKHRFQQVAIDYSILIFVGTLAVIHFAYLSESGSRSNSAIAVMLIMSTAIWLPWYLLNRWKARRIVWIVVYLVIALGIAYLGVYSKNQMADEGVYAQICSCITPALALIFALRHDWSAPGRDVRLRSVLVLVALILTLAIIAPWSVRVLFTVGSIPIAFTWLVWLVSVLACGVLAAHHFRKYVLRIDAVLAVVAVIGLLVLHHEKPGVEWLGPKPAKAKKTDGEVAAQPAMPAVKAATEAAARSGTQLAIHADGGGLRAALFTAEVLAIADDLTCGDFGSHVFAASGVSGGSLGIATWAVMRAELKRLEADRKNPDFKTWIDCKQQRTQAGAPDHLPYWDGPRPLWTLVVNTLLQDHLSTTLASMLTTDFLRPWGTAQRGQALLDSWQQAALDTLGQLVDSTTRKAFAATLADSKAGFAENAPNLLFTATDVDAGARVVFSNADWAPYNRFSDLPIGLAALNSARFPLVSPAGALVIDKKWRRLADGGYFDNSGAASLRDMLIDARATSELKTPVVVARINGNARDPKDDTRCGAFFADLAKKGWWLGPLTDWTIPQKDDNQPPAEPPAYSGWSGIDTYMATRPAHADEAVLSLDHQQMPDIVARVVSPPLQLDFFDGFDEKCAATVPKNEITPTKPSDFEQMNNNRPACVTQNQQVCFSGIHQRRAPLGWALSRGSGAALEWSARSAAARLLAAANPP